MSKRKDRAYNQYATHGGKRQKYMAETRLNTKYMLKSDAERKYFTTVYSAPFGSSATTSSSWTSAIGNPPSGSLFCPTFGADITNRVGRKCVVHSIRMNMQLWWPADTTVGQGRPPVIRVILASLVQAKGGQPLAASLMSPNGNYAFRNLDYLETWKVLKDKTINFPTGDTNEGAVAGSFHTEGFAKQIKINWKSKKGMQVHFTALSQGDFGDIDSNNICCFAVAGGIDYSPTMSYVCRVGFTDV